MEKNKRNQTIPILIIIFIMMGACNIPLKLFARFPKPYPTLDPAIFENRKTPTSLVVASGGPTPIPVNPEVSISYFAQSGDTLKVVSNHFGVLTEQITSPAELPATGLITPGQQLIIPRTISNSFERPHIFPDSAVINSPCALDFDLFGFIQSANGYLNGFTQTVSDERVTGAQVVQRVAEDTSVNPLLLLAFIEFRSQWVYSFPSYLNNTYPLGFNTRQFEGLYHELALAARMINTGYYAWRQGQISKITYIDGLSTAIAPNLNAGSVGIQYLFAQLYPLAEWEAVIYGPAGFFALYTQMFGDPWLCAQQVEPLFRENIQSPVLELPFAPGEHWALTGGLHPDWNTGTPFGALDFAPVTNESHCIVSSAWVRAAAPGVVSRSKNNQVIVSLHDPSGNPTGWEVMYMHIANQDRVALGTQLKQDDPIGHPSCEGGASTGTHFHVTRKFKGEWISAGEPFPLVLSGWLANPGEAIYRSTLVKDGIVVTANSSAYSGSLIIR